MTYTETVKASREMFSNIKAMKDGEVMEFVYGTKYDYSQGKNVPAIYELRACIGYKDEMYYSVYPARETFALQGMNVDKVTSTSLRLYTYDMMGQRTSYVMPLSKMKTGLIVTEQVA
jgi:hypothetical protein